MRRFGLMLVLGCALAGLVRPAVAVPTRIASVPLPGAPSAVTYDPISRLTYVAIANADVVSVLASTGTAVPQLPDQTGPPGQAGGTVEIGRIKVGDDPRGIASDGRFVYVTNFGSGTMSIIAGLRVIATTIVGPNPWGISASLDGKLCVAVRGLDQAYVYDSASASATAPQPRLLKEIVVGAVPVATAIDRGRCYVANSAGGTVSVIDLVTNNVAATIPVSGGATAGPKAISADPVTGLVWSANFNDSSVSVINPLTQGVTRVSLGANSFPTGIAATGRNVYVSLYGLNAVAFVNPVTRGFVTRPTGTGPVAVAATALPQQAGVPATDCAVVTSSLAESATFYCDLA